jgi:Flp pilus assembly protein TadG
MNLRRIRTTTQLSRESGQSAVEIALVLPLLLTVLVGIIMVGFIMYAFNQVSNAAREGARAGSLYRTTQAQSGWTDVSQPVQNAIYDSSTGNSALGSLPINASSFVVTRDVVTTLTKPNGTAGDPTNPRPGDRLTARVTYSYTIPVLSSFLRVFPQPLVIKRDVMMEIQ